MTDSTKLVWWFHAESDAYFLATRAEVFERQNAGDPDWCLCEPIEESLVPEDQALMVKDRLLDDWYKAKETVEAAKKAVEKEQELRKQVAQVFFPDPVEGTNTLDLGSSGWKLKLTHKIDRKLDEAALEAVKAQLREMGVNPDPIIEMKPSLVLKAYKGLKAVNEEAIKVFDQALTIKPASPTLEIVPPKTK